MIRGFGSSFARLAAALVMAGGGALGFASGAMAQSAGCVQLNNNWSAGQTVSNGAEYGGYTQYNLSPGEVITYQATSVGTPSGSTAGFALYADDDTTIVIEQYAQPGGELNINATYTVQNSGGIDPYIWSDPAGGSVTATISCAVPAPPPTVSSVVVPANGTYGIGDSLDFTVNFDGPVTVTGTPILQLVVGATSRAASYVSGSGSSALVFRYTIPAGDLDANGVALGGLNANGGTIQGTGATNATLTLNSVGSTAGVLVDGAAPTVTSSAVTGSPAASATTITYRVEFSESVTGVDASVFTLAGTGTASGAISAVSGSADSYDVTVSSISGIGTLRLNVNAGTGITDAAGNGLSAGYQAGAAHTVDPRLAQTITFANPGSQNFGTTPTLTATTDSGLTATFSSSTTGVCTITAGGALTFISTGTCTIDADQAGDGSYFAAPTVSRSFTVNAVVPAAPTIGTASAGDGQASIGFTAPASSGGAAIVGYTVTANPGGATGTGSASPIVVMGLTNGVAYTFTVTATNSAGTGAASAASNSVTPAAAQVITFANPGAQNFGTSPTLTATATSGLSVSFTTATPGVCTVTTGGSVTFVTAGTCTINADQLGDAAYLAATQVSRSFTVAPIIPGAPSAVVATAGDTQASVSFAAPLSSGGSAVTGYTVTVSPADVAPVAGASSPIVVTGLTNGQPYSFTVTADTVAGPGPASSASNTVTPAGTQTISFANPGAQTFGTSPTLTATADSGLTVSFSSATTSVCTITSGGALTFLSTGTCTVDADQAGNSSYLAATQVSRSFTVVGSLPGAPTAVSATGGVGAATVSFTAPADTGGTPVLDYTVVAAPGGASATGTTSPITVNGLASGVSYTFTVTARTAIGSGPQSAASAPVVLGTAQNITFADPGPQLVGTPVTLVATASSGLPVAFASASASVCTVSSAGLLTPLAAGNCVVTADQAGDVNYLAAAQVQRTIAIGSPSVSVSPDTGALAGAMAGEGYETQFSASGQLGQVLWAVSSGTLPSGLVLNVSTGMLSGTIAANAAGDYAFTITATDQSGGGVGSAAVTLAVSDRAVTAENKVVTVPAGSTPPPINLVENATGGPFTGANVASVEPANGGRAEIIMGMVSAITSSYPSSFYLKFTPNPQYSGSVVVRYALQSALGTSNTASVTIITQANPAAVSELFSDMSRDFVTTRGNLLASGVKAPGLRDRRSAASGTAPGSVNGSASGNSVTMNFASSTLEMAAFQAMDGDVADIVDTGGVNFWIDGTATLHVHTGNSDDHWGSFALLSAGADMLMTEDILLGVALYTDWMEDSTATGAVTGQGVLVGPYVSAELVDGVFFDASLLYGKSWNEASTSLYSGAFTTDRLLARASLEGTWDLGDQLSFRPLASLFYLREEMGAYSVSDGAGNTALVDGFATEQLRLGGGGSFHYVLETDDGLLVQPFVGFELGLSLTDGQLGQFATLSGGVDISAAGGWSVGLATQADFAEDGFRSVSARARLGLKF